VQTSATPAEQPTSLHAELSGSTNWLGHQPPDTQHRRHLKSDSSRAGRSERFAAIPIHLAPSRHCAAPAAYFWTGPHNCSNAARGPTTSPRRPSAVVILTTVVGRSGSEALPRRRYPPCSSAVCRSGPVLGHPVSGRSRRQPKLQQSLRTRMCASGGTSIAGSPDRRTSMCQR
jgi:hypothetical protein